MKSMKLLPVLLFLSTYLPAQKTNLCNSKNFNVFSEINRGGLLLLAESADAAGNLRDTVFERQSPAGGFKTLLCNDSIISFIYTNDCCHLWYTYQHITDREEINKYMDKRRSYNDSFLPAGVVAGSDRQKEFYEVIEQKNWKMINMRFLGLNDQSKYMLTTPAAPADTTVTIESDTLEDPFTLKQRLRKTSASGTETIERVYKLNSVSLGNKLILERRVE